MVEVNDQSQSVKSALQLDKTSSKLGKFKNTLVSRKKSAQVDDNAGAAERHGGEEIIMDIKSSKS